MVPTIMNNENQWNQIGTSLVERLDLPTTPHPNPYPLGWISQNTEVMIERQCRLKFAITKDFINEVLCKVAPINEVLCKAADYLEQAEYSTGNPEDDLKTQSLVRQLVYNPKLQNACPVPFDEAKLWQGESGPELKQMIQKQFRNISALMDCVGCEKCRLWGKLQVLGLGTALKILFSVNGQDHVNQPLQMQRNEVIALVNLLNRLSESVNFVHEMGPSTELIMEKRGSSSARKAPS